jgi:hypothetical protein
MQSLEKLLAILLGPSMADKGWLREAETMRGEAQTGSQSSSLQSLLTHISFRSHRSPVAIHVEIVDAGLRSYKSTDKDRRLHSQALPGSVFCNPDVSTCQGTARFNYPVEGDFNPEEDKPNERNQLSICL